MRKALRAALRERCPNLANSRRALIAKKQAFSSIFLHCINSAPLWDRSRTVIGEVMPELTGFYALVAILGEVSRIYIALQQAEAKVGHLPML